MKLRIVLDPEWPEGAPAARAFADELRRAVSKVGGGFTLAFVALDSLPTSAALAVTCSAAELTGSPQIELTRDAAHARLASILERDLAYRSERIPSPRGSQLAEAFLARFSASARFFTNGDPEKGWTPLTSATFDCGVVAVDVDRAGVLWVEDED